MDKLKQEILQHQIADTLEELILELDAQILGIEQNKERAMEALLSAREAIEQLT